MITLIGGPEDHDLLWLAAALQRRDEAVEIVLPEEILTGATITCRIDRTGHSSSMKLRDGRSFGCDEPHLVINRLTELPPVPTAGSAIDAAYLGEEWRAVLAAWLRTLRCPVLNPPRAASLSGPVLSATAWRSIARAHGIACRPWTSGEPTVAADPVDVLCVAGTCLDPTGEAPGTLQSQLARVSRFAGAPLLGARFDRAEDWQLVSATAFPPLADVGTPLVDALIALALDHARIA